MSTYLRRLMAAALAVAVLGVTACDDGTDPVATATVEVLAYVDANNSNSNDAGDVPIEGATVTLSMVGSDASDLTQTTGTDGVATFDGVEIGSYTASIEIPSSLTGVTLASASTPTVAVDEDGATVSTSFRYTYNPGAIMGHVFIGSTYGMDVPAVPGLTVTVSEGGTDLTSTETDATGAFMAGGLLPGEYEVAVDVPGFLTGTASQTVTLTAEDTATSDFGLEIGATVSVADARAAAEDDTVAIIGTAISGTAGDSAVFSSSSFYMQDASGISIYLAGVQDLVDVMLGDSVVVYGVRGSFSQEVQLSTISAIVLGEGTLPTPETITAYDLNVGQFQGQLVTMQDFMIDSIDGGNVWGSEYTTGEDVLFYLDSTTGLDGTNFAVGTAYDVTGVAARFNELLELKPRMTADIVEETSLPTSVQDVRDASQGTSETIVGVVTEDGTLEGRGFYLQDATAGIFVYTDFGNIPADLAIGDVVEVVGPRDNYFAIVTIGGQNTSFATFTELRTATTPIKPASVTALELNSGDFQSQLVVMEEVVVDSVVGSNVYVSDANGDGALIRLDSDADVPAAGFVVGEVYTVKGVVSNFGGTEQLKPRFLDDVTGFVPVDTMSTIAEARTAEEGTPAVVPGVVTVDHGNFGDEVYIQDAEAGIAMFDFSALDGLVEGDSIMAYGVTGVFNGNIQIAIDSVQVLAAGATLPTPVVVTGAELNAGSNPGELVNLQSITVDSVVVVNSFDSHNVFGQAGDGSAVVLYVDNRTGLASTDWTAGTDYNVTGIMSFRDTDTETYWRIQPRKPADVTTN